MNRKEKIMKRLQEHYNYLISLGYEVICLCLQGSQNYNLDEYSEEYMSDIDTKAIVLPHLDDFIMAASPISTTIIMDNNEHIDVKDIRIMFDMFKKMNVSYIELLYTDFKIINPEWANLIEPLFANKELVSSRNRIQFIRCIYGMATEKRKALCHPYPNTIEKIEKYGYDGKQLHHCARLFNFISRYVVENEPLESCYKVDGEEKIFLMNLKKQKDADGDILGIDAAIGLCDEYVASIKEIKDEVLEDEPEVIKHEADEIMRNILLNIMKKKMIKDLK